MIVDSEKKDEMRIPVIAPTGRDAKLIINILDKEKYSFDHCHSVAELMQRIDQGSGPAVIAEEALNQESINELSKWIAAQPEWSDLPLIIFKAKYQTMPFKTLNGRHNMTYLQRPIHVSTFVGVIRTALEARKRQYQIRDLLDQQHRLNAKLDHRAKQLQKLTFELTNAEYHERNRMSDALHDDLQQMIVAVKLNLQLVMNDSPRNSMTAERLRKSIDVLQEAVEVSRTLSYELSPPTLRQGTLMNVLNWMAEDKKEKYGLDVRIHTKLHDVDVDDTLRTLLYRIIKELLFNVVKHADTDAANVYVEAPDSFVRLTVSDNGKGFDPAHLRSSGGESGGFGLLSISERISLMGGTFEIESAPGRGSRFVLTTPPGTLKQTDGNVTGASGNGRLPVNDASKDNVIRILIADDHRMMRKGLVSLLQHINDIEVIGEAENGQDALRAVREHQPDLVLMDIAMPKMNGIKATGLIHNEMPEVTVIGLSMFEDEEIRKQILANGAYACLSKSVDAKRLIRTIRESVKVKNA